MHRGEETDVPQDQVAERCRQVTSAYQKGMVEEENLTLNQFLKVYFLFLANLEKRWIVFLEGELLLSWEVFQENLLKRVLSFVSSPALSVLLCMRHHNGKNNICCLEKNFLSLWLCQAFLLPVSIRMILSERSWILATYWSPAATLTEFLNAVGKLFYWKQSLVFCTLIIK